MKLTKQFKSIESQDIKVQFTTPNECPICHSALEPIIFGGSIDGEEANATLSVHCGCRRCNHSFLARYQIVEIDLRNPYKSMYFSNFIRSEPIKTRLISFGEHIESVSPSFVEIYNQAKKAEDNMLTHLCGIGYRKALEFLIKDFAINCHPDDSKKISEMSLSQCIENYINHQKLHDVAKAASWLGNDETHYTRKHVNYDINDLKIFIEATVNYINIELISIKASNLINRKNN